MEPFATIDDLTNLWRAMTEEEQSKATNLLSVVSNLLRNEADKVGKDLDSIIESKEYMSDVVKSVTCDIVARVLQTPTSQAPMSQFSESAGGYTVSGTFLSPGGGIFIKQDELKRLGLKRQQIGVIDIYEHD